MTASALAPVPRVGDVLSTGTPDRAELLSAQRLGREVAGHWLWRDLSFILRAGERVAVVGPSGSGKTLLLRTLAGLDPLPEGEICFEGKPLRHWSLPSYRARVLYLSQRPTLPPGTVEASLQEPFTLRVHRDKHYDHERVVHDLEAVGRSELFLGQRTEHLSGGEAQLVAFLRAVQLDPSVLLLDEPTASLDEATARQLEALVTTYMADAPGRAYLWTSHDPSQLERVTDRRVVLQGEP